METTVHIPDPVYREGERVARARGFTLEQFIVHTLERELSWEEPAPRSEGRISLPVIHSKRPGTLDLTDFNFDDLLA